MEESMNFEIAPQECVHAKLQLYMDTEVLED